MRRWRIVTKGGEVTATERDRWPQLDGRRVPTGELTTADTVPGFGRVLLVARIVEAAA